jgi:hypothetical protein
MKKKEMVAAICRVWDCEYDSSLERSSKAELQGYLNRYSNMQAIRSMDLRTREEKL